jgi:hypothetical protein
MRVIEDTSGSNCFFVNKWRGVPGFCGVQIELIQSETVAFKSIYNNISIINKQSANYGTYSVFLLECE